MGLEVRSSSVMEEQQHEVWSGGVHVALDCPLERAWDIMADFGGLSRWNPTVTVCDVVEGKNKEPGCVRYCRGAVAESWVYERLLVLDEEKHGFMYQMEDNRFRFRDGVQGYASQFQLHAVDGGKTFVDWTYTLKPVANQTYEQFTNFMTGFYMFNLNILQSAANAAQEQNKQYPSSACKLMNTKPLRTT